MAAGACGSSFETPHKGAAPQDDGECVATFKQSYAHPAQMPPSTVKMTPEV
jgi:hypothetical protein